MTSPTAPSFTADRVFAAAAIALASGALLLIAWTVVTGAPGGPPVASIAPSGDVLAALRIASGTSAMPELVAIVVVLMALVAPAILLLVRIDAADRLARTSALRG